MIDKDMIQRKFEAMGARVKFAPSQWESSPDVSVDIARDRRGEHFLFRLNPEAERSHEILVPDLRPAQRHLLLFVRDDQRQLTRLLCGHDERFWFVAGVRSGSDVPGAMESLKPGLARQAQGRAKVKTKHRNSRRNDGFIRQGEWFFIPAPDLEVDESLILGDEPLSRGARSKPHMVQELFRRSGVPVYVHPEHAPAGLTKEAYDRLVNHHPELSRLRWTHRVRNPEAYVRGRVTHPDHRTLTLPFWHRVAMSDEQSAGFGVTVAFLD